MIRRAAYMLLLCRSLAPGRPLTATTSVALIAHFERPPGQHLLNWIAPTIAEVFRPAGLSLAWHTAPENVPVKAARTLHVWFHGDCWPMAALEFRGSSHARVRLGWVLSHDGHIGPDIEVDCALVMQVAAAAQSSTNRMLSYVAYLRIMERVVSHELMHVLLMSAGHGVSDCTRARLEASEWRRIGHLTQAEANILQELYGPKESVLWGLTR